MNDQTITWLAGPVALISKREAISKGTDRYFTGKPCKRGHISERYVKSHNCIACQNDHNQNRDFERMRWANRQYMEDNKQQIELRHGERRRERRKERYRENIETERSQRSQRHAKKTIEDPAYVQRNRERAGAAYRSNPSLHKMRSQNHKRSMTEEFNSLSKPDQNEITAIYAEATSINKVLGKGYVHVDHILPRARGGPHHPGNLQIIAKQSNLFWRDKIKRCPFPKPENWHEPEYIPDWSSTDASKRIS